MPRRVVWTMSAALALLLIISVFALAQPTAVSEATLIISSGEVIINRSGGPLTANKSVTAVSGEVLVVSAGDLLTTNATAVAELRLADGGVVELAENTTVEITHLVTTEETYQVTLTMMAGRTLNRVVRLLGVDDAYQVRTPSSTASVRGTVFTVDVLSANSTYVAVDEGIVQVSMGDQAVDVKAGFEVTAVLGELLIVKQHNQPGALPKPAPTATAIPPTPTTEPEPTAEPASTKEKSGQKSAQDVILLPMLDAVPIAPPETIPGAVSDLPIPGSSGNPIPNPGDNPIPNPGDNPVPNPGDDNGGNPHDGMTVPGNPPSDPGDGSPPAGGAPPPGQGGTPPGQTSNPGQGGGKKDD